MSCDWWTAGQLQILISDWCRFADNIIPICLPGNDDLLIGENLGDNVHDESGVRQSSVLCVREHRQVSNEFRLD